MGIVEVSPYLQRVAELEALAGERAGEPTTPVLEIRCGVRSGKKSCRRLLATIEQGTDDSDLVLLRPAVEAQRHGQHDGLPSPFGHAPTIFPVLPDEEELMHTVYLAAACKHGAWTFAVSELQTRALDSTVRTYAPQRGVLTAGDLHLSMFEVRSMSSEDRMLTAAILNRLQTAEPYDDLLDGMSPRRRARVEAAAQTIVQEARFEHWRSRRHPPQVNDG